MYPIGKKEMGGSGSSGDWRSSVVGFDLLGISAKVRGSKPRL
jgi:hypothetical protein